MRTPKYLSPTSISKFYENRETFYLRYLCDHRTPRPPQQDFMAVGSALDAFCKFNIYKDVHGEEAVKGTQFDFEKIFEDQVEEHVRDVAMERATDLWQQYNESGAYKDLILDILKSPSAPEMEFTAREDIDGVPLLGKPDLMYFTPDYKRVISDWKVNGSTSKSGASPVQGYKIARDFWGSNTNGKSHKKYRPTMYGETEINEFYLEDFDAYWADQLSVYSWLLGEPVGSEDCIIRMEQVACRKVKTRDLPRAKFATHVCRVSRGHQLRLWGRANEAWNIISSGHIFDHLTREKSDEMCWMLDNQAKTPDGIHTALDLPVHERMRFKK